MNVSYYNSRWWLRGSLRFKDEEHNGGRYHLGWLSHFPHCSSLETSPETPIYTMWPYPTGENGRVQRRALDCICLNNFSLCIWNTEWRDTHLRIAEAQYLASRILVGRPQHCCEPLEPMGYSGTLPRRIVILKQTRYLPFPLDVSPYSFPLICHPWPLTRYYWHLVSCFFPTFWVSKSLVLRRKDSFFLLLMGCSYHYANVILHAQIWKKIPPFTCIIF